MFRLAQLRKADAWWLAGGTAAIGVVTYVYTRWPEFANPVTVSTTYLMIVLILAATSHLGTATTASIVAVLCFNYFFLPPVGTFTIADPQNWAALFAFLAVSVVASNLSARVRARERDALARRDEMGRLFDLSRDVLMVTDSGNALTLMARSMARRFDLAFVAIALPRAADWQVFPGGNTTVTLDQQQLWSAFASAQASLEFDAYARTYSGQRTIRVDDREVWLTPLRSGTTPIGLLATSGQRVEPGTLDALAGIGAIAIERAQMLDERKAAALTKQSEQLKAALLASIGHDLRTPLTAIRVAATNVRASNLSADERQDQIAVILSEAERLTRLFENILEMARIDAGAVAAEARWTHPSEILDGARCQVEEALRGHRVSVQFEDDRAIKLDPRLAAAAIAHVLENAAQYSPQNSSIDVTAAVGPDGLTVRVRDYGPGIPPEELSHIFDRFYRGDAGSTRVSGTGTGLWIARGLLAVQGGRIWADNALPAGAQFTITIPVATRTAQAPPAAADDDTT